MLPDDETLAWIVLTRAPELGVAAVAAALERLGSARAIVGASDAALAAAGIPTRASDYLRSAAAAASRAERRWLDQPDRHVVPFCAPGFPALLSGSPDCPLAFYVAGRRDTLREPPLAVVGSRRPTPQGLENAFELARALAARGVAIASGLALGADAAAHRGALAARGATLAVLGNGLDVVYPRENRALREEILARGALVSAFPLGTMPRRSHFPRRNRILAAMTLGTLVIEAARGSGSLLTARAAARAGRALFAVPGSIHNPLSRGCHALIKSGAHLVEDADDIFRELQFPGFSRPAPRLEAPSCSAVPGPSGMDKEHKILLDALGFDPADLDTLVVRTGLKPEAVSSMMLILELEGHVQVAPGGRYSRVAGRRAGGERQRSRSAHLPVRELHERR
jgi:DNA processing protein